MRQHFPIFARLLAVLIVLALGCERTDAPVGGGSNTIATAAAPVTAATPATSTAPATSSATENAKPFPETMAQAETLRTSGVTWTNEEIRLHYNRIVTTIGPANEKWKKDGLSAEERARRASEIRHSARILCRAMMSDAKEVEDLRKRDQEKYGNPDGPTFEQLVAKNREKGMTGDAAYEEIVASSQRTNEAVNKQFGIDGGVK